MYRLVIVDDEQDIRQRLTDLVGKSGSNFEIAAEYENGIDAYEGITADSPDLIITDIKIPYIDGIELIKKVREVLPLVKVIVITGFNEFDYAKEAANLGVMGFISKPITLDDVRAILQKAEEMLNNEFVTAANINELESFYTSSLPIIRENDLYRLSTMTHVTPAFEKKLKHNDIDLDYRYFAMGVFDFDQVMGEGDAERFDLAISSIRKIVEESMRNLCKTDMFGRHEKLCLILKSNEPLDAPAIENAMEQVIQRVGRYSDMPLSVGVSNVYEDDRNFARMLGEALRALEYRGAMGGRKVLSFGSVAPTEGADLILDDNAINELGYLVRFSPLEDCVEALDRIRAGIEDREAQYAYYYTITAALNVLIKSCDDLEGLYARYQGPDAVYRRIFEAKTADEAFGVLREVVCVVRELNDEIIVDNVARNLKKVLAYLDNHYTDPDISFESMSREVNLSVSYISALLKKNLNTTFVKQLTQLRMEKAKELLHNPALKIIDIAEQLGYADPYYFSHCFKKYTGVSPKEYRSNENE